MLYILYRFPPKDFQNLLAHHQVVDTLANVYGQWSSGGGAKQERLSGVVLKAPWVHSSDTSWLMIM